MDKKSLYLEKLEARLAQYSSRLALMHAQARNAQGDLKLEYLSQIEQLEKKHKELQDKYKEIKAAGGEAWKDIKEGADKAWKECKEAFNKASKHFK